MLQKLSQSDIKILLIERRMGIVLSGIMLFALLLANFFCFFLVQYIFDYIVLIIFLDTIFVFLSLLVEKKVNQNVRLDLQINQKEILERKVEKKYIEKAYEVGSHLSYVLYLFNPKTKIWGMKEFLKYRIVSNNYHYTVEESVYNDLEVGDQFYVHFASNSGTILAVKAQIG